MLQEMTSKPSVSPLKMMTQREHLNKQNNFILDDLVLADADKQN